jgi:hypothetical protein
MSDLERKLCGGGLRRLNDDLSLMQFVVGEVTALGGLKFKYQE